MSNEKRTFRNLLSENLSFVIYFVIMLLLTIERIVFDNFGGRLSDNNLNNLYTIFAEFIIMGIVPVVLYVAFNGKENFKSKIKDFSDGFGFKFKLSPSVYVLTIVVAILIYHVTVFTSMAFNVFLAAVGFKRSLYAPTIYKNVGDLFLGIFMTAFAPALCEEITHRGLIYSGLKKYGEKTAVFISAVLFALMHQNIMQVFYAFIAGLILGTLRSKTRSIIPGMIVHFGNNLISTLLEYSSQHNGKFYDFFVSVYNTADLLALVLLIASFIIVIKVFKAIFNYMGNKCGNNMPIGLSRGKRLVLMETPALAASLTLGFFTTLITLIWGFMR